MTIRKLLFVGSLASIACGCSQQKPVFNDQHLIAGNATPVLVQAGATEVLLSDYVLDPTKIDSVSAPSGITISKKDDVVVLQGEMQTQLAELLLWSGGQAYAIPLQKTSKTKISLRFSGTAKEVKSKGEFNSWNPDATVFQKVGNEFATDIYVYPGNYQYLFVVDGKEIRDPLNKDSVENGMGGWNSIIRITKPDIQKLPLLATDEFSEDAIQLTLQQPASEVKVYWKNFLLSEEFIQINNQKISVRIPEQARQEKRSFIRAWAANQEGISNDVLIPFDSGRVLSSTDQLTRSDKEAQVLYFMMVDRFYNGNPQNDEPVNDQSVHPKANYLGGDIAGVTQQIKYFKDLGVNTLWLSPITQNPKGAFGKYTNPNTTFSGYHGYWPITLTTLDHRFGTRADLESLIRTAHENNMNVILDYVAHHVHQEHPLVKSKPEWFTPLYLPDGTINTERWDDQRLTTWFDVFLPTLDLRKPEVVGPMTDTAMFWLEQYELDGFRHDASKHIDLLFWRELTKKIKGRVPRPIFQIGETYGSRELVNSYVNTGMLDAQFDFNLYDDAVAAFARSEVSFDRLVHSVSESMHWFGDHHLMGNVTGNQDRARFISYADGSIRFDEDTKRAGWTRKIEIRDTLAYKKLRSLTAFMMTVPGVPVIYYGDDIGDPGGNDPDNRRMMRFNNLNAAEKRTLEVTQKLIKLRREKLALIYGDLQWLVNEPDVLVFKRSYFNDEVIVAFNKSSESKNLGLDVSPGYQPHFSEVLSFENGKASLTLPPYSFEIITRK